MDLHESISLPQIRADGNDNGAADSRELQFPAADSDSEVSSILTPSSEDGHELTLSSPIPTRLLPETLVQVKKNGIDNAQSALKSLSTAELQTLQVLCNAEPLRPLSQRWQNRVQLPLSPAVDAAAGARARPQSSPALVDESETESSEVLR